MFRYYNANPKNRRIDDCVIRSISVAEGISWDEAYHKLSSLARRSGQMVDSVEFVEQYLNAHYERKCFSGMKVKDIIKRFPRGTYIISMKNHLSVIKDGINYDTFDTANRTVWCIWKVK